MEKQLKRIHLSAPHMTGMEEAYIHKAFESNWIAPLGPNVDAFEEEVASYLGVKSALAVSSGTAAIHLALRLLDIKPNDTVFCSTFTFVASANPILYEKGVPVFIDSDTETWNMSPIALKKAFKTAVRERRLPKAVIVVNLYGQSAQMDEIVSICDHYGVPIIEDAAESLGALYKGRKSGTIGKFGVFSFNGNKIISTSGGGMLVSNDEKAIHKAKFLATQAKETAPFYQHQEAGYNYRMSNILAGIGLAQIKVLEKRVQQKREIYNRYFNALNGLEGLTFMPEYHEGRHTRWLTTLLLNKNSQISPLSIVNALNDEGIEARLLWKPMHLQPLFRNNSFFTHDRKGSVAEGLFERGICLPSGTGMATEDQFRVIESLKLHIGLEPLAKVARV
ncbi:DegT/DnrJ/EryC1/StrS family aminotransferase [Halobacillus faecis]